MVAFIKIFRASNTRFDRHDVKAIFGEQGGLPLRFADPHMYRNDAPAIRHKSGYRFQVMALLFGNGDEKPRGWTLPEPDRAAKLEVHRHSISNAHEGDLPVRTLIRRPYAFQHKDFLF